MSDRASAAAIAAAAAYESLHVPALFGEWAGPLLDAAKVTDGQCVADVACGTGILARTARERVGQDGSVVGVDPDAGMLAVAARSPKAVTWPSPSGMPSSDPQRMPHSSPCWKT